MIQVLISAVTAWIGLALVFFGLWVVQTRTRDATPVDVAWSYSFGAVAISAAWAMTGWRPWFVAAMITLWSLRLGTHLLVTRVIGHTKEDGRYVRLRAERNWGSKQFFIFYQLQAVLVAVLLVPMLIVMGEGTPQLRVWDLLGLAIWAAALVGESIADQQLKRFVKDPANRGRTCQVGLWRYSRHPNYFFEWLHWWAYVAIGFAAPYGWMTLMGPVLMLWFLFKVTGIPPTERQALKSRSDYAEYQRTTSVFVPWVRRR